MMRSRLIFAILFLLFPLFRVFSDAGDFVKDIRISDFEISIPNIKKETLDENTDFYKLYSDDLPICNLEIHIYGGESWTKSYPVEIVEILAGVLKFGGSKNYPDGNFLTRLERLGAKFEIESDYKKIKIDVSFLSKDQDEVLGLISDLLKNPALTDNSIEHSKRKLQEKIKRRNDSTDSVVFRKAKELLFKEKIAGKSHQLETLEKIQAPQVLEYFNEIIGLKKTILVSGSFDENKMKMVFSDLLKSTKEKEKKISEERLDLKSLIEKFETYPYKNIAVEKSVNQSAVLMTGFLPAHNHPDFYAVQVLNYIIGGGGFNSYFMQEIRSDRGLAYSAVSYPVFKKDHGYIYFFVQTKNETTKQVFLLMKEILSDDRFEKITDGEIQSAKNAIQNQFVFLFSNQSQILSNVLRFSEDDMPKNYLQKYRKEIGNVTLPDLKRVGKKYFNYKNLKTIIVGPKESHQFLNPKLTKIIAVEDPL